MALGTGAHDGVLRCPSGGDEHGVREGERSCEEGERVQGPSRRRHGVQKRRGGAGSGVGNGCMLATELPACWRWEEDDPAPGGLGRLLARLGQVSGWGWALFSFYFFYFSVICFALGKNSRAFYKIPKTFMWA